MPNASQNDLLAFKIVWSPASSSKGAVDDETTAPAKPEAKLGNGEAIEPSLRGDFLALIREKAYPYKFVQLRFDRSKMYS